MCLCKETWIPSPALDPTQPHPISCPHGNLSSLCLSVTSLHVILGVVLRPPRPVYACRWRNLSFGIFMNSISLPNHFTSHSLRLSHILLHPFKILSTSPLLPSLPSFPHSHSLSISPPFSSPLLTSPLISLSCPSELLSSPLLIDRLPWVLNKKTCWTLSAVSWTSICCLLPWRREV